MRARLVLAALLAMLPLFAPAGASARGVSGTSTRYGSIVYITANYLTPGVIGRYDLAARAWLAPLSLPGAAGAFAVDEDGFYLSLLGGEVLRYDAQWANPVVLAGDLPAEEIVTDADRLFMRIGDGRVVVLDKESGLVLDDRSYSGTVRGLSVARGLRRLFAAPAGSAPGILAIDYSADGKLGELLEGPPGVDRWGHATWVLSGEEHVVTNAGDVFRADDLAWESQLYHFVDDIEESPEGLLAINSGDLVLYGDRFGEIGRERVLGYYTHQIFVEGDEVFGFEVHGDASAGVTAAPLALMTTPREPVDPEDLYDAPTTFAFDAESGVLFMGAQDALLRYSVPERRFLESVPLRGWPLVIAWSPSQQRVLLGYSGGGITTVSGELPTERPWKNLPARVIYHVGSAGDHVIVCDWRPGETTLRSYDVDGNAIDSLPLGESRDYHSAFGSSDTARRFYWLAEPSPSRAPVRLRSVRVDAQGGFETPLEASTLAGGSLVLPSPDGSRVLLADGSAWNGETLEPIGSLPAWIGDGAWLDSLLVTHYEPFYLDAWSGGLEPLVRIPIEGGAIRVIAAGSALVEIRERPFRVRVREENDLDGDGVAGGADRFPADPAEWSDRDGDGSGDNGDAFPDDPAESLDTDSDGTGDNADAFPFDPAEWADLDRDGWGDNSDAFPEDPGDWSDADGDGSGDNADLFPFDPTEWADTDLDGTGDNADAFPYDPLEIRDYDGDGIGDRSDPYPIGEPFFGFALEGRQRVAIAGLGVSREPLGGHLGLLESGVFSLCDGGGCVFGSYLPDDDRRRGYRLVPEPGFLTAAETAFEAGIASAFDEPVTVDLEFDPESLRFDIRWNRRGTKARVRMRVEYVAKLTGAPPPIRRIRGGWAWVFEPVAVGPPPVGSGGSLGRSQSSRLPNWR